MLRLWVMFVLGFFMISPCAARAETSIAARVGDAIITTHDVETRLKILFLSSKMPEDERVKNQLRQQIRELLIDEEVQRQAAKRADITIDDADIKKTFAGIEQRNAIAPGQLVPEMAKKGIDEDTLKKQVLATLGWQRIMQKNYQDQMAISDADVAITKARMQRNQGKTEYYLSEILLFVNTPQQEDDMRKNAMTLYEQLIKGARFESVARQFSQSATSANGGVIGWVVADQLPVDVQKVITRLDKGAISQPLRTQMGYKIYKVNDQRLAGVVLQNQTVVDVFQTIVPFVDDAKAVVASTDIKDTVKDCSSAEALAKERGYGASGYSRGVSVGTMPKPVQEQVMKLKIGQTTPPMPMEDTLVFMTLCAQSNPAYINTVVDADTDNIKRALFSERATQLSQQLLRRERENAVIVRVGK
ncbi:MAG: peptidylprolyl isomerase [Alphaproteobacteria bacterium]